MVFQKNIPFNLSTSSQLKSKQGTNYVRIENPLKKDIFINGIELILAPEFTKKGKLLILVNEVSVFDENNSDDLKGYQKYPIPLGKILKRGRSIEIFAWNGTDTNTLTISGNLALSEELQPFNSQAMPLGQDVLNDVVSENETLFEDVARDIGTFTKLLNMKGFKKLIVFLSKSNPALPNTPTVTGWVVGSIPSNLDLVVDNDFSTKSTQGFLNVTTQDGDIKTDFGSILNRHPKIRMDINAATSATYEIFTSDDDIVYNSVASGTLSTGDPVTLDGTEHSFRYMRADFNSPLNLTCFFREIYDSLITGGTGALSFEVRNPITDTWSEFIASSEFGTTTGGAEDLVEQIGDVNTISVSGKTYGLPSTQTDFRAKYTITNDPIKNSISIELVA